MFCYFRFAFILTIRLEPYPTEVPEISPRIDPLKLSPYITFPLHCFSCIYIKPSGHSLHKNADYDKDVLIFYNENSFGLVELGQERLQRNAEMGGEGEATSVVIYSVILRSMASMLKLLWEICSFYNVFWGMKLCHWATISRRYEGTYLRHSRGSRNSKLRLFDT